MTTQQTAPEPPVSLPDPTRPPKPAPGCDVCVALEKQRTGYERRGNVKAATTCEVEMRNHPKHSGSAS